MSLEEISGMINQIQVKQTDTLQIKPTDYANHEQMLISMKDQLYAENDSEIETLNRQVTELHSAIEDEDIAVSYIHGECMEYTDRLYSLEQQISAKDTQKHELEKQIETEITELQEQINKALLRNIEKRNKLAELKLHKLERNRGRNFVPASWLMDN